MLKALVTVATIAASSGGTAQNCYSQRAKVRYGVENREGKRYVTKIIIVE